MAARLNPSKGAKPDKLMRDALIVELNREGEDENGKKRKKFNILAANLVKKGMFNDLAAIIAIFDRVDGKPPQAVSVGQDPDKGPLQFKWIGE